MYSGSLVTMCNSRCVWDWFKITSACHPVQQLWLTDVFFVVWGQEWTTVEEENSFVPLFLPSSCVHGTVCTISLRSFPFLLVVCHFWI